MPLSPESKSFKHVEKSTRNQHILKRYQAGDTLDKIAAEFGISSQRVYQIIKRED